MMHKKYWLGCIPLALILLLMAACSPTGTGTGTSGGSTFTVAQVLQNSAKAMQDLKSAHIDMTLTGTAGAADTGTSPQSSATFNVKGSGDEALPDQEQLQLTTNGTNLAEIVQGNKVYIQNPSGQWYVIDKDALQSNTNIANPFSGIDVSNISTLLAFAQHAKLTDNGIQSLNGQNLRHITIQLDREGLKQLLNQDGQLATIIGKQNVDTIIDSTKDFNSNLDLWIDENQFYLHRTELKLNVDANLTALQTPVATATATLPSNVSTKIDSIIDLSKFNDPVTITPPSNAIPTSDPTVIFK